MIIISRETPLRPSTLRHWRGIQVPQAPRSQYQARASPPVDRRGPRAARRPGSRCDSEAAPGQRCSSRAHLLMGSLGFRPESRAVQDPTSSLSPRHSRRQFITNRTARTQDNKNVGRKPVTHWHRREREKKRERESPRHRPDHTVLPLRAPAGPFCAEKDYSDRVMKIKIIAGKAEI
jgi:hypothetical protein